MGYQISELDAVNLALVSAGSTPVSSIDNNQPDVLAIKRLLTLATTDVQKRGWWFNREYSITLSPDAQGRIIVPQNAISADSVDVQDNFVLRGDYLYDRENATYNIGRSIQADIISRLDWDELPYNAQNVAQYLTAVRFVGSDDGDADEYNRLQGEYNFALAELKREHLRVSDTTVRANPVVARVMYRRNSRRVTTRFGGANR